MEPYPAATPQGGPPAPFSLSSQGGGQAPERPVRQDEQALALSRQVGDLLSRLRLLEERYANLRREHQLTSQNMIEHHQALAKQQRKLMDGLLELKRGLHEIDDQIGIMQGELSDTASVHDVKAVERYLDLWQPLDFVSRQEALRMVREAVQEALADARKAYKLPSPGENQ
jgi:hypothetical protein